MPTLITSSLLSIKIFGNSLILNSLNLFIGICLTLLITRIILSIYFIYINKKKDKVCIKVTPLTGEILSIDELNDFIKIVASKKSKNIFKNKNPISLEIYSNKIEGLNYFVCTNKDKAELISNHLKTLSNNFEIHIVDDYFKEIDNFNFKVYEFKLSKEYFLPLNINSEDHILNRYFKGVISNLKDNEFVCFQLICEEANLLSQAKIRKELNLSTHSKKMMSPWPIALVKDILKLGLLVARVIYKTITSITYKDIDIYSFRKTKNIVTNLDKQTNLNVLNKMSDQLFKTNFRLLISVKSKQKSKNLLEEFENTLILFNNPDQQIKLVKRKRNKSKPSQLFFIRNLSLSPRSNSYLSAKEIASFYDFGSSSDKYDHNQVKSLSRVLPLPTNLRDNSIFDITLGKNTYMGDENEIGLTQAERQRHIFISGSTGSGKTTLIKHMINQDVNNGKGFTIVDPHGDLAESIIRTIPKKRLKDVIYFNPRDISHPICLNLLETSKDLIGDEKLLEQDLIIEQLVSIFRKLFSKDDSGGNRLEHILRNAIATAFLIEDSTIFTVYRLLIDAKYRLQIVNKIEDKSLVSFWQNEYGSAGSMQRVKLSIGITSKIGRFLRSAVTRRILSQPVSSLDFDEIINKKKILICNLSKGQIGEDNSQLIGSIIIAKLQLSAYKRANIKESARKPHYLYVDEFQNFATNSFLQLLSEGRKYKLHLIMAEQSPSQQELKYISNVLANVGTIITFRTSSPQDEKLLLPIYEPYIKTGEIMNLPIYNFYCKISSEEIKTPTSGVTITPDLNKMNSANKVILSSRKKYSLVPD
ncbi:MAG TPA: type IV secretion system DNA-binding domain-containing protein [Patescibacteria group bacterium]|nr:type IV secretion system DNA-binding domain-containing protein [Patescibacteria group bacterium]